MVNQPPTRGSVVDAAVNKLASAEHYFGASIVCMPSLYPSGSSVVLEISGGPNYFHIDDRAGAYFEAESMAALRLFKKEAERISTSSTVQFDGRMFSVSSVSKDALASAMRVVAHNSQMAANLAATRIAEKNREVASEELFEKLVRVFSPNRVSKDVPIIGASQHEWRFDAMISGQEKPVVFDAVTSHAGSVVWAAAKFADLARLEREIGRVAVIDSRAAMGEMIGVLSPNVSAIIELSASPKTFLSLEAA